MNIDMSLIIRAQNKIIMGTCTAVEKILKFYIENIEDVVLP
jgi:hypothetical protein